MIVRLDDLEIICAVLGCGVEEVLIREPDKMSPPVGESNAGSEPRAATGTSGLAVTPKRRDTRTLPPL